MIVKENKTLVEFSAQAAKLVTAFNADRGTSLSREALPVPPDQIDTNTVAAITTGPADIYDQSAPVERVSIFAPRQTFRNLGILAMSTLFHENPKEVVVNLLSQVVESELKEAGFGSHTILRRMVFRFDHPAAAGVNELWEIPKEFQYWPNPASRHPWHPLASNDSPYDLPHAYVSDAEDIARAGSLRDTLFGFGNASATARFAELLLNIGHDQTEADSCELECEVGFRGVGPGSVELMLHTPESVAWECTASMLGL